MINDHSFWLMIPNDLINQHSDAVPKLGFIVPGPKGFMGTANLSFATLPLSCSLIEQDQLIQYGLYQSENPQFKIVQRIFDEN